MKSGRQKTVEPRRPRGRPRTFNEPMETVTTRLPLSHHAKLCTLAREKGKDLALVVREILIIQLS